MGRKAATRRRARSKDGAEIRELTRDQILQLIDERARYLLGISGDEFMRRYKAGELEAAPAEAPITMLADLVAR
jgi:hypothetical protein